MCIGHGRAHPGGLPSVQIGIIHGCTGIQRARIAVPLIGCAAGEHVVAMLFQHKLSEAEGL